PAREGKRNPPPAAASVAGPAGGRQRLPPRSSAGTFPDMADSCCSAKTVELERLARHAAQRRVLVAVMAINATMFVVEFAAGAIAGSTALMADAADMLGDALVYAISLYALSRGDRWKAGAALAKGLFILVLGVGIVVNVVAKIQSGVPPSSTLMLVFGTL